MVKISAAVAMHKAAGLPYLVYLRHPRRVGPSRPSDRSGTLPRPSPMSHRSPGPRVYRAIHGHRSRRVCRPRRTSPPGTGGRGRTAGAFARSYDQHTYGVSRCTRDTAAGADLPFEPLMDVPTWDSILRSRRPERPGVRQLLRAAANTVTVLQVPRRRERAEPPTRVGEVRGRAVRSARSGSAACRPTLGPAGLREAQRGMRLAAQLRLPLVTVIDTAGAALGKESRRGWAGR